MGDSVFGKVSVAIVTPFTDAAIDARQPIDFKLLDDLIAHVAAELSEVAKQYNLIGGIIVSGTTGEQHTMTAEERKALYKAAVTAAEKFQIAVVAGVSATTTVVAMELAESAVACGCRGLMLGLPPYCRLCDEEVREYVSSVRRAVPQHTPILLYNNVMRNGYGPSNELLAEMTSSGLIWGVKHAVHPAEFATQAAELVRLNPAIRLYTGSDKMSGELLCSGGSAASARFYGLTSILGNLAPRQVALMIAHLAELPHAHGFAATDTESDDKGSEIHARLSALADSLLTGCSLPAGLKYALCSRGLGGGFARLPVGHLSAEKKAEIDASLDVFYKNYNL